MKEFANVAGKIALAAAPIALGGMFKKAYGQSISHRRSVYRALATAPTFRAFIKIGLLIPQ